MELVLDHIDLQILQLMQENSRISNVDMAKQLEMAPSAVLERVKKLEQKKVILHYTTGINPAAQSQGARIRLFDTVFVNPHPEKEIQSIDYVSGMARSAPFMVALTIEL